MGVKLSVLAADIYKRMMDNNHFEYLEGKNSSNTTRKEPHMWYDFEDDFSTDFVKRMPYTFSHKTVTPMSVRLIPNITKVIFNKPATIVLWNDGTKTVVKTNGKEKFSKEYGLSMAISKKFFGTRARFLKAVESASDKSAGKDK